MDMNMTAMFAVWFTLGWTQKSLACPASVRPPSTSFPHAGCCPGCTWVFASWQPLDAQGTISTCTWTPSTTGCEQNKVRWSINHTYHTLPCACGIINYIPIIKKAELFWKAFVFYIQKKIIFLCVCFTVKYWLWNIFYILEETDIIGFRLLQDSSDDSCCRAGFPL